MGQKPGQKTVSWLARSKQRQRGKPQDELSLRLIMLSIFREIPQLILTRMFFLNNNNNNGIKDNRVYIRVHTAMDLRGRKMLQ